MESVITSAITFCMIFGTHCVPCSIQVTKDLVHETCCCHGQVVDWGDIPEVQPSKEKVTEINFDASI